jgi:hypothetical protein
MSLARAQRCPPHVAVANLVADEIADQIIRHLGSASATHLGDGNTPYGAPIDARPVWNSPRAYRHCLCYAGHLSIPLTRDTAKDASAPSSAQVHHETPWSLRLLPCLLLAACAPLLSHCGGDANPVTETGNPPAIKEQQLHLVLRGTGVEIVGDPGAVSPGALVRVTNRTSGVSAEATALVDGSVTVAVPGSLSDEYEMTVSSGTDSRTVRVAAHPAPSGVSYTVTSLTEASCAGLEATLGQLVDAGFSGGAIACQQDSDCAYAGWGVGCYSQCGSTLMAASDVLRVRSAVEQTIGPVCAELASRCSVDPASSCPPPPDAFDAECVQGMCRRLERTSLSCDELAAKAELRAREALDQVSRDCTVDGDCAQVSHSVSCVQDCGNFSYVSSQFVESLNAGVRRAESYFCSQFESNACAVQTPLPCGARTISVACESGKCETKYSP